MDSPGTNELLIVTKEQFLAVRKTYNATAESLKRDVDSIIDWYKLQPHLPQIELDRGWIERVLVANKCSLERTKNKIDMLISSRNLAPDIFLNRNPEKALNIYKKTLIQVQLPKLLPDNTRVIISKYVSEDGSLYDTLESIKIQLMMLDYRQMHDYSVGDRIILDIKKFNSSYVTNINLALTSKALNLVKKSYGQRVASVHILFTSPVLEWFLKVIKFLLPAKLQDRVKVHPDLESLYKEIPKKYLPKDYGGDEISSEEMFEKWQEELTSEKQVKYFKEIENIRSDESKRMSGPLSSDTIFGAEGSFKMLNLD